MEEWGSVIRYAVTETVLADPGGLEATVATAANESGLISVVPETFVPFTLTPLTPLTCPLGAPSLSFESEPASDGPDDKSSRSENAFSVLAGAGALRTSAAVGPLRGCATGLRAGGVTEPVSTGNSSALGTRCCECWWWADRPFAAPRFSCRPDLKFGRV